MSLLCGGGGGDADDGPTPEEAKVDAMLKNMQKKELEKQKKVRAGGARVAPRAQDEADGGGGGSRSGKAAGAWCGRGVANATASPHPDSTALPARLMAPSTRVPPAASQTLSLAFPVHPAVPALRLPAWRARRVLGARHSARRSARAPSKAASVRLATRSRSRHRCLMTLCRPAI